jgi:hypothetical protein
MDEIIFTGPINSLSFGNVSYNFLRSFYESDTKVHFFPVGKDLDFSAFDKVDNEFKSWIDACYQNRYKGLNRDIPHLRMWHINGSEMAMTPRSFLYTFYELSEPTEKEITICNLQSATIFSSQYSLDKFKKSCDRSHYIPIGFDKDFYQTDKEYLKNKIHFGLMGKFEKRKHTARILKYWAEKFGNNPEYQLSCCINNTFLEEEDNYKLILDALSGERYSNINILPRLSNNSEVNEFMNSIDIDLSGLSGAEGWNLPAFNSTCLGKWSVVLNSTSHKDWATSNNSILVEPDFEEECYDGVFFQKGGSYNQGSIYGFNQSTFNKSIDLALNKLPSINTEGQKLKDQFTYSQTTKQIMEVIKNEY